MERKNWIDIGKGISILVVILHHTEIYYTGSPSLATRFLIPPIMNFFFFISGYLYTKSPQVSPKKKLIQISRSILLPYFIFTSVIFIPKMFKWGAEMSFETYFIEIFLGQASWFVMALAVGQIIMIYVSRIKNTTAILTVALSLYCAYVILLQHITFQPYYFLDGFRSVLFLVLGYKLFQNEAKIRKYLNKTTLTIAIFAFTICVYLYITATNQSYALQQINNLVASVLGLYIFTSFSELLGKINIKPLNDAITYIGRNSLTYYFLNGGVISILVIIANRVPLLNNNPTYPKTILLFLLACGIITIATMLILRYLPAITGKKDALDKIKNMCKKHSLNK